MHGQDENQRRIDPDPIHALLGKRLFKTFQHYILYIYIYGMSHRIHSVRVMSVRREPRSVETGGRSVLVQCV